MLVDGNKIIQIGMCVKDLDKTMKYYTDTLGLGPWYIFDMDSPDAYYNGKYGEQRGQHTLLAVCEMGPVVLELISVVSGYSVHRDFLEEHGEGVDHIAVPCDDIPAAVKEMEAKGFKFIEGNGKTFAYLDMDQVGGIKLELLCLPNGLTLKERIKQPPYKPVENKQL